MRKKVNAHLTYRGNSISTTTDAKIEELLRGISVETPVLISSSFVTKKFCRILQYGLVIEVEGDGIGDNKKG